MFAIKKCPDFRRGFIFYKFFDKIRLSLSDPRTQSSRKEGDMRWEIGTILSKKIVMNVIARIVYELLKYLFKDSDN